jgi:hypothetical protein
VGAEPGTSAVPAGLIPRAGDALLLPFDRAGGTKVMAMIKASTLMGKERLAKVFDALTFG